METMEIDPPSVVPSSGEKNEGKPIVVMLIGLPGSGKSTFCDGVMKASSRQWARACQDTANNGKAGTKIQCLSIAATALNDGKSVLIDRCNIDRGQRAEFLKLGGPQTEKHAVVLDLPPKLCISRSVKRTEHEGNLQGGRAAAVVNQMALKKELPKLSEGFRRITFCQTEKDVEEAIGVYGSLAPSGSLPSGCFGQKNPNAKTQQGIMKFFKKADPSTTIQKSVPNETPSKKDPSTTIQKSVPSETPPEKDSHPQTTANSHSLSDDPEKLENSNKSNVCSASGAIDVNIIPTLAFPSISTADFQFDLDKASDIIVEKVEEYIKKIGKARLVLVDLSRGSKVLSLVKTKANRKNINSSKFSTFVGDITQLHSQGGLRCNVIANATNWRLKPGGGGVNSAIFNAAGSALVTATKAQATTLATGKAVVIPLPSSSLLYAKEGVTHVIHVLGPNMNPMRPDCLGEDYTQGCKLLREAYSSLFEGFVSILRSNGEVQECESDGSLRAGNIPEVIPRKDDQKTKREGTYELEKSKKSKVSKMWPSWAQALYDIAMHPEKHENVVLELLDDVLVMKDAYPKAQNHLLVLVRAKDLDSIADVHREHLPLLKTMHSVGLKWAEKFISENKSLSFRIGYHSVPSMQQLHLHVISQDFDSIHLKNKKHWNSFTTPFFLDSVDVIKELEETGNITLKDEKSLGMELRCHRCRSVHPNIPRLKSHILSCQAPFPDSLLKNGRIVSSEGTM